MEAKENFASGDSLDESGANNINQLSKNANDGGGFRDDYNAGETINGGTLPVPVYRAAADSEIYACDANVTTKLNFIGFAISNSTDGNAISIQTSGIVRGFSGLTIGSLYYVQDAVGTIGTSRGTYSVLVGIAVSATEILITKNENERVHKVGVATRNINTASGQQTIAHGLGKIPKVVRIAAVAHNPSSTAWDSSCFGVYNGATQSVVYRNQQYLNANSGGGTDFTIVLYQLGVATAGQTGVVSFDATNIIIDWTKVGSPDSATMTIQWEAEG